MATSTLDESGTDALSFLPGPDHLPPPSDREAAPTSGGVQTSEYLDRLVGMELGFLQVWLRSFYSLGVCPASGSPVRACRACRQRPEKPTPREQLERSPFLGGQSRPAPHFSQLENAVQAVLHRVAGIYRQAAPSA